MLPRARIRLFLALFLLTGPLHSEEIAIRCGSLLDVDSGELRASQTIVVDGDQIREIGSSPSIATDASEVDLSDHTCLPGLIDLHAHISLTPTPTLGLDLTRASADRALDALYAAQKMLDAGFTTLRDPGAFDLYYATVAVKRSIASGEFMGPRLFVAPHALSPTGGHGDLNTMQPEFGVHLPGRIELPEGIGPKN